VNQDSQFYVFGFGLILLGGLLIVSGMRNRSLVEVIQGITSPQSEVAPAAAYEGAPLGPTQPWEHQKEKVAETIYHELTKQGLTPVAAAGLIGNAAIESGLNPAALGDQGTSSGLWQFHAGLQHYGIGPVSVQVHNMLAYLRSNPAVYQAVQHARSPQEAARIFEEQIERPASVAATRAAREAEAAQAYRRFALP